MQPRWVENALTRLHQVYTALEAHDRLLVDCFDGGHAWSGRLAYPQLAKVLNGREGKR